LCIDEAHVVSSSARSGSMLLDLVDSRIDALKPTYLAMNTRWNELRGDPSRLLVQIREKLEDMNREVLIPGGSRREKWVLDTG